MSKIDDSVRFYRKMSDLQEKLRRSEEERLQLEEKFALLMRACRDDEEIRLNMLREKYEKFLEEEKIRKERNERILLTLERIESRANMLTAKSERLRLLRRHYEAYLMRMYPKWKYITDKSKAATDQDLLTNPSYGLDEKMSTASFHPSVERELSSGTPLPQYNPYSNFTVPTGYQFPPPEERTISSAPAARPFSTSTGIPPLPTLTDSTAKYDREGKIGDGTSPGQIPIIRMQGSVLPERTSAERPIISGTNTQILSGAERTTELLGIKPDHRHPLNSCLKDAHAINVKQTEQQRREFTISEQEQNTSGDLLNVSLSDDGILHEETEHSKNENMATHTEDTHENRRELAGGKALQMNSKTSQRMAAVPLSSQLGAGDSDQQRVKVGPQNQKTEPENRRHQVQDQTRITKQYNQENRQNLQQYVSEQHLQPYEPVNQPQHPILELQKQSNGEVFQSAENQLTMQGQTHPVPEEHMSEQPVETVMQQSKNYTDEYQKQFIQQSAEPNDQYNQQLAGMQEGQNVQLYDQEYPAQFDQQYSEEGQLNEQYNLQYHDQSQIAQQYNLQYSEQDQVNQQYYEQYPEESDITQQYDQQYDQQYAEQNEIDQQYAQQNELDQQYSEQSPNDQLYQQQYDNQSQFNQDSSQYVAQYGENQQAYPEEVSAIHAYSEQQYNDDGRQDIDNQQYSVTAPSGEGQEYEQNLDTQVEHMEKYNENVQQQHSAEQLQQKEEEQQLHEAEELHQQQLPPLQEQQQAPPPPLQEQQQLPSPLQEQQQLPSPLQEQQQLPSPLQEQQQPPPPPLQEQQPPPPLQEQQPPPPLQEQQQPPPPPLQEQQQPPPPPLQEQQQLSPLAAPQQEEPQKQNQADTNESQQNDVKEAETASRQQTKKSDEHHSAAEDKQPEGDIEEYRRLLGETGEVETSETDELEAQLAELVEPKANDAKEVKKTSQQPKAAMDKSVSRKANPVVQTGNIDDTSSSDTDGNIPQLLQEASATKLTVETLSAPEKQPQPKEETVTPVSKVRPSSKRLPVLNKVLESDSESLQLDATVSNAESDDFDFSSEQ